MEDGSEKVMVCGVGARTAAWIVVLAWTSGAAAYSSSPACDAPTVQMPGASGTRTPSATEHVSGVADSTVTGRPESATASSGTVAPASTVAGSEIVISCWSGSAASAVADGHSAATTTSTATAAGDKPRRAIEIAVLQG